jgi:alkanesulfonate monooxygenase SsuD/methylene tetrahydromethanopterin reductase-like flavin-dependent oxidoreductase (luciferase family)
MARTKPERHKIRDADQDPMRLEGDVHPVQLFCWHFMAYPYLPPDFDQRYDSGWVTVPNSLWDKPRAQHIYQEYIDQLVYADELGYDGMVLNEHHQNIYGLMPSPNIIAGALTQRTSRGKIVVLGNLLPLHRNPLRVAEEYAMLDNMSGGRLIAGLAIGGGPEAFNYNVPQPQARAQFWEAVDLIKRAWTEPGPFAHEGKYYPNRYVNPWPRPLQEPHPPIWIPGALSLETMEEVAKRGHDYFLSSRAHGPATKRAAQRFSEIIGRHGGRFHPFRMGLLISVYVAETDDQAREESREGIWYFLKNTLKGHLRKKGRGLTFGTGVATMSIPSFENFLKNASGDAPMLGDCDTWEELEKFGSIVVGSPRTVRARFWELIEQAQIGNFLIQFHFGNMQDRLTRKSMRLFATEVAPVLRRDSADLFARYFPALEELAIAGAAQ